MSPDVPASPSVEFSPIFAPGRLWLLCHWGYVHLAYPVLDTFFAGLAGISESIRHRRPRARFMKNGFNPPSWLM